MLCCFRDLLLGWPLLLLALSSLVFPGVPSAMAQSPGGVNLRVMAANLPGDSQKIEPYATNIFAGLKPDIVAIQEFNYENNTIEDFRRLIHTTFGTNFSWYREPISGIPNGVISRYPFVQTGSWSDPEVGNRGFAWAQIDLPGTNDLYVVSVHFLTSGSADRATEANSLKTRILASFPAGAWIIVAGDFNTDTRTETAVTTFNSFLSDSPIPTDAVTGGNSNTSRNRTKPYDYVLVSQSMTNRMTNTVVASYSYPKGLVFDSAVFPNVEVNVPPVLFSDSANGQHMAVLKDFHITFAGDEPGTGPAITDHPQSRTNIVGETAAFEVSASGTAPLTYLWSFNGTNVQAGVLTTYSVASVAESNAGPYRVIVTNSVGSATSEVAILTVVPPSLRPNIVEQPQSQAVAVASTASFRVIASGAEPLSYQWRSNGLPIAGATATNYVITNAQPSAQAGYSVLITNQYGSITSSVASLQILSPTAAGVLAGWDVLGLSGYGPSPYAATTNNPLVTVDGLIRGPGVTTVPTAAGNAWGGNGFNATTAPAAILAGDYVSWSVLAGNGVTLSFTSLDPFWYRRSGSGPPSGLLQAQVGSGAFSNIATMSFTTPDTPTLISPIDLSGVSFLQNVPAQTSVTFRLVIYGATSSGGNWYVINSGAAVAPDLVMVGRAQPVSGPPAAPPVVSVVGTTSTTFQLQVSGTPGSNYVVEASKCLSGSWEPIHTNFAPFTLSDTNAPTTERRFFRGRVQ